MEGRIAVVEFHAFRDNFGQFIVKELVLVNVNEGFYTQLFFKPPYDRAVLKERFRKQVEWLENNYHRIPWEYGDVEYSVDTIKHLCSYYTTIYTKGEEKFHFLRQFHNNVRQIPDNAPKLKVNNRAAYCPAHPVHQVKVNEKEHCALQTALFYAEWLKKQNDYTYESSRLESFVDNKENLPPEKINQMAKYGFYYDKKRNKAVCVWCNDTYDWHVACVNYYVHNIPKEFDVVLPRI